MAAEFTLIQGPQNLHANAPFQWEDLEKLYKAQRIAIDNIRTIRDAIHTRNIIKENRHYRSHQPISQKQSI